MNRSRTKVRIVSVVDIKIGRFAQHEVGQRVSCKSSGESGIRTAGAAAVFVIKAPHIPGAHTEAMVAHNHGDGIAGCYRLIISDRLIGPQIEPAIDEDAWR